MALDPWLTLEATIRTSRLFKVFLAAAPTSAQQSCFLLHLLCSTARPRIRAPSGLSQRLISSWSTAIGRLFDGSEPCSKLASRSRRLLSSPVLGLGGSDRWGGILFSPAFGFDWPSLSPGRRQQRAPPWPQSGSWRAWSESASAPRLLRWMPLDGQQPRLRCAALVRSSIVLHTHARTHKHPHLPGERILCLRRRAISSNPAAAGRHLLLPLVAFSPLQSGARERHPALVGDVHAPVAAQSCEARLARALRANPREAPECAQNVALQFARK